ncbi:dihydrolipoyl dehydrogenase [Parapusillimonas granuli]|uniref:Dihydrolipoyl dehydrogenase n=1 Tax=Parapusillimonas granuli TaxID=380911 RepID=A0A853FUT3_9BURK|nr:dihydrolipoyl dehydrogenase [Parapusillimonas granuli]MBB5213670.1 dihydrolipoamide dehydrogenase [Parapusillimonas granuli]NYT48508.1 dihydrolipoyl dehydrogenase [Parapusillimonas granuli]
MSSPITVDAAVIGAGTAGLTAFSELRRQGLSAVLIDHGPLGTTCARVGCMPSKAALHAGHQWASLQAMLKGAAAPAGAATPGDLWRHARMTRDLLAGNTAKRTRDVAGDRLVMGTARFTGPGTVDVDGRSIRARAFVVATGSRPVVPQALAALGDRLLTTDSLFDLDTLPGSVGMLGLGAIGLEMGLALSRLGVRVVAGDMKSLPAGITDPRIGARAIERFGNEMTMWLGRPVETMPRQQAIELRSGGETAQVDAVLAALGRRPNVEGLDLQMAGVPLDARGQPVLDAHALRAGSSAVFLAGDASAIRPLMHEAVDEGLIAARAAAQFLGGRPHGDLPPRRTPLAIVFSDPDIATVGQAYDTLDLDRTVIGSAEGAANGRSRVMGAEGNLVRIYADRGNGRLLGAGLLAARGEHLAHLLAWAVQRGETVESLLAMPYYHPSIEEMVQSALKDASRQLAASR